MRKVKNNSALFGIKDCQLVNILLVLCADALLVNEGKDRDATHLCDDVSVLVGS